MDPDQAQSYRGPIDTGAFPATLRVPPAQRSGGSGLPQSPAYPAGAVIVDLERPGKTRAGRFGLWMALASALIVIGFIALAARPPDPESAGRSRERILAVLPSPTLAPIPTPTFDSAMHGPSVLAQITPAPSLPPPHVLPQEVATVATGGDALGEVRFAPSERSRPTVYRLPDGRLFVVQQMGPDRGRPVIASYGLQEGLIRGWPAELINSTYGPIRSLVWWNEPTASYYLYSRTLTVGELVRLANQMQ